MGSLVPRHEPIPNVMLESSAAAVNCLAAAGADIDPVYRVLYSLE
jgi:hypothetical protein